MNFRMIVYIVGQIIKIEGLLFLVPTITSVFYQESQGVVYGIMAISLFIVGILITFKKPKNNIFYIKEGCVATALCWIILSVLGAIPFIITKEIPSFTDAVFEVLLPLVQAYLTMWKYYLTPPLYGEVSHIG